jgi:hypothetical protein
LPLWTFGFKTKVTKDITKTTHSVVSTTDSDVVVSKVSEAEIISKTVTESELPIFKSALDWPLDYLVEENRVGTADAKVTVQRDSSVQKDTKLVSPVLSPSSPELTTPAAVTDNSTPIADGMLISKPYTLERHVRFNKTHEVLTLTGGENNKINLVIGVNYEPPTTEAVSADIIINSRTLVIPVARALRLEIIAFMRKICIMRNMRQFWSHLWCPQETIPIIKPELGTQVLRRIMRFKRATFLCARLIIVRDRVK